ncbi:hypothetical protein NA57DRAFT_77083 [Rhizodiscina lignyota]|uniref:Zn(2)-C6 fungal-type domain-containing protein n=1 Tax=Rhizodiscina lignyota TaxID=1504668 RepID=A0A9P4ICH3_9PEZI|nr:hypothetical protein NA57DRAFT_77083 [Rhizodiscina lignyota]
MAGPQETINFEEERSQTQHLKSRHTCDTCKQAHLRCDRTRPICGNCTRSKRECSYAPLTGFRQYNQPQEQTAAPASSSEDDDPFGPFDPNGPRTAEEYLERFLERNQTPPLLAANNESQQQQNPAVVQGAPSMTHPMTPQPMPRDTVRANTPLLIHLALQWYLSDQFYVSNRLTATTDDIIALHLIHGGDRPHRCDNCGSTFTNRGNLNRHKKSEKCKRAGPPPTPPPPPPPQLPFVPFLPNPTPPGHQLFAAQQQNAAIERYQQQLNDRERALGEVRAGAVEMEAMLEATMLVAVVKEELLRHIRAFKRAGQ